MIPLNTLENSKQIVDFALNYSTFWLLLNWFLMHYIWNIHPAKINFMQNKLMIGYNEIESMNDWNCWKIYRRIIKRNISPK